MQYLNKLLLLFLTVSLFCLLSAEYSSADNNIAPNPNYAVNKNMIMTYYGSYPQGKNGEVKPIVWYIVPYVTVDDGEYYLLISKNCLDVTTVKNPGKISPLDSPYIKWLNNEFMKKAFSEKEISTLFPYYVLGDNNYYRVGLLSSDIYSSLLMDMSGRFSRQSGIRIDMNVANPTDYARKKNADISPAPTGLAADPQYAEYFDRAYFVTDSSENHFCTAGGSNLSVNNIPHYQEKCTAYVRPVIIMQFK